MHITMESPDLTEIKIRKKYHSNNLQFRKLFYITCCLMQRVRKYMKGGKRNVIGTKR